jgi:acyl-CoA reductase-like NAD-dependent aldehyde dehydrogenase
MGGTDAGSDGAVPGDQKLIVTNPFDLKPIDEISRPSWGFADQWLDTAVALHRNRDHWLPAHQRIAILKRAATLMRGRFEELAFLIANEGGKPLIDARVEVERAIDGVGLAADGIAHLRGTEMPMDLTKAGAGRMAFTAREPIGPVVAISAFNHPLNLIVHQVAPAVAVGCPVIVKPADDTPLSARAFVDILIEAGLPSEWCAYFPCDIPTAEKLVTDARVAFFSFIGSSRVGWMLRSKLAPGTRCALEHGGAAPVIVDESADLDAMVPSLIKGGFYHAGQVCVSVQRVYAPRAMAQGVAERLADKAARLVVGNAVNEATEVGPLIRPGEVLRVADWVDEAAREGGKILCGGDSVGETAYQPTVVLDPPHHVRLSTQEVFGPVVAVYGYDDLDDAISMANALPFAFHAAGFTQRLDVATKLIRSLDATSVMINDHTAFRVDWMPFAGRRQSGYGTGGIDYTMHDMTQDKMAVIKF